MWYNRRLWLICFFLLPPLFVPGRQPWSRFRPQEAWQRAFRIIDEWLWRLSQQLLLKGLMFQESFNLVSVIYQCF